MNYIGHPCWTCWNHPSKDSILQTKVILYQIHPSKYTQTALVPHSGWPRYHPRSAPCHPPPNVTYYCVLLSKHPNNIHKRNEFSWWWLELHNYSRCKNTNNIIYNQWLLIWPNQTPEISIYIQWVEKLLPISYHPSKKPPPTLLGPFNFDIVN